MCGRFAWFNKSIEIQDSLKAVNINIETDSIVDMPNYNIAPSQRIIAIKFEANTLARFQQMKWGLDPPKFQVY